MALEMPGAAAVSSIDRPAKKRSSITRLCRAWSFYIFHPGCFDLVFTRR